MAKQGMPQTLVKDLTAGMVVFLVALPLCLGVALASNPEGAVEGSPFYVPLLSGLVAGVVGGIIVGLLSRSHTSVSGPAAGLTAVVAAQITSCGSFSAFLVAVVLAGVIQIAFGVLRAGILSNFVPSSVIKGLLAAIGVILILKQLPHLVGHDPDPEGDLAFVHDGGKKNTFTDLIDTIDDIQPGACLVGFVSLVILFVWGRVKFLKYSPIPVPLIVVVFGVVMESILRGYGSPWVIESSHLVQVPVMNSFSSLKATLAFPDFSRTFSPAVLIAAVTIAIVATLETLLNLEAVDKIDPKKRVSPPNRELIAQGCGNIASGMLGGIPVTSVIVRSSVNINAGGVTKFSAIFHGVLLAGCVLALPGLLNRIPLSCLAAILIMTGLKLMSWKVIHGLYKQGWMMFLPFVVTVVAIVFTDLLIGILIGLATSLVFIMRSNLRKPLRRVLEKHIAGDVLHIQLASQVSFLNRAMLLHTLEEVPQGGHVLIDARDTDYIDPDVFDLIRTFEKEEAPARGVFVSLVGFHDHYEMDDRILYADYTSREVRDSLTPDGVLQILKDGHDRFLKGEPLMRNMTRQITATADGQTPLAVVLSCIDSRTPTEIIFDVGLGDIFTVRIAGNVAKEKVRGSLEFATKVAGAKLILVMGHTRCGAVNAAINIAAKNLDPNTATGCENLGPLLAEIGLAIDRDGLNGYENWPADRKEFYADSVAMQNVRRSMQSILDQSNTLRLLVEAGTIKVVGCLYDVRSGRIEYDVK